MPDSDRVQPARWILLHRRFDRLIERIAQEILSGVRFDSNEPVHVLGFEVLL